MSVSIPESHLAQEAIAALVDGELPAGAAGRAARHLSGCMQCRLAVEAQREAKEALLGSQDVAVPGDLLSRLCAIPFTADVPGAGGAGAGTMSAGPGELTMTGASGAWSLDLAPEDRSPQGGPGAGSSVADRHTEVVPPVIRTVTIGRSGSGQGGTP